MGKFILTDARVHLAGRDLSADLSTVALNYTIDAPECTAFGDLFRRRLPGVLDVNATYSGYWDSIDANDSLDKDLFDKIGAISSGMTVAAEGGDPGDVCFFFEAQTASYY